MKKAKSVTYKILSEWITFRKRMILEAFVVGIFAGAGVTLFRYILEKLSEIVKNIYVVINTRNFLDFRLGNCFNYCGLYQRGNFKKRAHGKWKWNTSSKWYSEGIVKS